MESQNARQAPAAAAAPEASKERSLCILLAEDNLVNQKLAVRMLEKRGHTIMVANNGLEALQFLEGSSFDVVLMDVHMPEMDGLTASTEIRRREKLTNRHTPIIALTANAMKGDRERCMEAGCDDYVSKPIDSRKLFEAIERLVGKREERVETVVDSETADFPSFDKEAALQCVEGDEELLKEVIGMFRAESPGLVTEIEHAVKQNDKKTLDHAAHTLKGMAANVGARRVREYAYRLESAGRAGNLEGTPHIFQLLKTEVDRFEAITMGPED